MATAPYESIYIDANYKFHVLRTTGAGDSINTKIFVPAVENPQNPGEMLPNLSAYEYEVYLNGRRLSPVEYTLGGWDDAGTFRLSVTLTNGNTFESGDYVVVLTQTRLTLDDITFGEGQRINAGKLNSIFKRFLDKLEELKAVGVAFASNTLFDELVAAVVQAAQGSAGNVTIDESDSTFTLSIPPGTQAYFKSRLIDELAGITPEGYDTSTITAYGLRTSSNGTTLVVTERKDDVPFEGVVSFAVEEGTTNLFTNPTFQNGESGFDYVRGWSSRTIKDGGPLGRYIELVDDSTSGSSYGNTFNVTQGQTYTFSVYINVLECNQRDAVILMYNWLDANGNTLSKSTSVSLGEEVPSDYVGQGWRRYKITATAPANAAKVRAYVYSIITATSRIQVTGFQFEQKPFATSFVNGTRADGRLVIPIKFRTNLVISGWFKTYGTSGNYRTQGAWARLVNFSDLNDTRRVTLAYNRYDSDPNFRKFMLGIRNASGAVGVTTSNVYPFNKWYFWVLIIKDASTTAYIFDENGNMEKIVNTNSIPSNISFSPLYIGHRTVGSTDVLNGVISNLLIARYDPAIWTDEYIRFLYEARKPFTCEEG